MRQQKKPRPRLALGDRQNVGRGVPIGWPKPRRRARNHSALRQPQRLPANTRNHGHADQQIPRHLRTPHGVHVPRETPTLPPLRPRTRRPGPHAGTTKGPHATIANRRRQTRRTPPPSSPRRTMAPLLSHPHQSIRSPPLRGVQHLPTVPQRRRPHHHIPQKRRRPLHTPHHARARTNPQARPGVRRSHGLLHPTPTRQPRPQGPTHLQNHRPPELLQTPRPRRNQPRNPATRPETHLRGHRLRPNKQHPPRATAPRAQQPQHDGQVPREPQPLQAQRVFGDRSTTNQTPAVKGDNT